jgi:hypothetical protein
VALNVAVPEVRVPVPKVAVPEEKVTVPVAAAGATVAVRLKLAPAATEEPDEVSVVVVAVEPVLVPPVPVGGSQKPLHPARLSTKIKVAAETGRAPLRLVDKERPLSSTGSCLDAGTKRRDRLQSGSTGFRPQGLKP